jgi:hypothetical protein
MGFHEDSISRYVRGECQFRLDSDSPEFVREHFGEHPEWTHSLEMRTAAAPAIARTLIAGLVGKAAGSTPSPLSHGEVARQLAAWCARRTVAPHWALTVDRTERLLAQGRLKLARNPLDRLSALRDYRRLTAQIHRRAFALRAASVVPAAIDAAQLTLSLGQLDGRSLAGFYPAEGHGAQSFRWSGTVAALCVRLAPGTLSGTIKLLRELNVSSDVAFFVDDIPLSLSEATDDRWSLGFSLPEPAYEKLDRWLVLHVRPWEAALRNGEPRRLGLPIESVRFVGQPSLALQPDRCVEVAFDSP